VPKYLVEFYLPSGTRGLVDTADRARAGAEALANEGFPVCYLRATLVPGDETCFLLFEGSSEDVVRMATERAGIRFTRIVEALQVESMEPGPDPTTQDRSDRPSGRR
jgi:hypothetical protein